MFQYLLIAFIIFLICYSIEKRTDKPQDFRSAFGIPEKVPTLALAILALIPLVNLVAVFMYILHYFNMKGLLDK